jgi:uncharacterized protein (DUF1499 family)
MIITRISGGLGNQMFQYAIAKSIAQKNNDTFKLDITFYPKQTLRKYELNLLNINENIALENESIQLRGKEGFIFRVCKKLSLPLNRPTSYLQEKENTVFDETIYNQEGNIYLDGFWQNEKYIIDIRKELIQDFTPKNNRSIEAQKYLNNINKTNSISLHVRRGDYVSNQHTNNVHGVCDINYYKRAIDYIKNEIENPIFYIFSDDIIWCKENFSFLKEKVFIDKTENLIDDLELMMHCKHNIIANSSFSWWGAWLNTNKQKIVISPILWWNTKRNLHPGAHNWKRL